MSVQKSITNSTKVAQYKLRRLAQRALRVLERHEAKSASLQVFQRTLVPIANEFITSYDTSRVRARGLEQGVAHGRQAIEQLRTSFGNWHGHLGRDVVGFSSESYRLGSRNPDDILSDAARLVALVNELDAGDEALSYADALIADIEPKLGVAQKEWVAAQDALAQRQEAKAKIRTLAAGLQRELVAFRSVLRNTIGGSHRDYQKVRLERAIASDPEDDQTSEGADPASDVELNVA